TALLNVIVSGQGQGYGQGGGIFGQYRGRPGSGTGSGNGPPQGQILPCFLVECPSLTCPPDEQVTLGTSCCSFCPDACNDVVCPESQICPGGLNPVPRQGDCCPSCPTGPPNCANVLCLSRPVCPSGAQPTSPPGECCSRCPECTEPCQSPQCSEGSIPQLLPFECCPTCQPIGPPNCEVQCQNQVICPNGALPITPPGECCSRCPECTEPCPSLLCSQGYSPRRLLEECCETCQPTVCNLADCAIPICHGGQQLETKPGRRGKPGSCPVNDHIVTRCAVFENVCSSDSQCPGPQKCCDNGCGRICLYPLPTMGRN
ncbi:Y4171-like protein, partial [Mya arenaria]